MSGKNSPSKTRLVPTQIVRFARYDVNFFSNNITISQELERLNPEYVRYGPHRVMASVVHDVFIFVDAALNRFWFDEVVTSVGSIHIGSNRV